MHAKCLALADGRSGQTGTGVEETKLAGELVKARADSQALTKIRNVARQRHGGRLVDRCQAGAYLSFFKPKSLIKSLLVFLFAFFESRNSSVSEIQILLLMKSFRHW